MFSFQTFSCLFYFKIMLIDGLAASPSLPSSLPCRLLLLASFPCQVSSARCVRLPTQDEWQLLQIVQFQFWHISKHLFINETHWYVSRTHATSSCFFLSLFCQPKVYIHSKLLETAIQYYIHHWRIVQKQNLRSTKTLSLK